jgi:hypothetical protein
MSFINPKLLADLQGDAQSGLHQVGGGGIDVLHILSVIVSILSILIGAVAIIVIILSGFRLITSGGDSNKVAAAKNTLIYALVGIAVAVLAPWLVHLVVAHVR